jgi:hypothetical protein
MKENKLIALFMGWKSFNKFSALNNEDDGDCWMYDDMRFNEAWNWLMPVVEKIENTYILSNVKPMVSIKITNSDCRIEHDPQHARAFKDEIQFEDIWSVEKTKLEATYKAIINFIKWYNEQKSKMDRNQASTSDS